MQKKKKKKAAAERERNITKDTHHPPPRGPSFQQSDLPLSSPESRSSINQAQVLPRILDILVGHLAGRPRIELVQHALGNPVEQLLGVNAEEVPGDVQRFLDTPGFVGGLADEGAFELVEEFERELVLWGQGFFSDDGFHGGCWGGGAFISYVLLFYGRAGER